MKRLTIAAAALLVPMALIGCGGESKKTAATVNGKVISEDEFFERALNIGVPQLAVPYQMGQPMKAGEYAMQTIIFERLMSQLAKEKNVLPTETEVNAYIKFAKKYNPQVTLVMPDPGRTEDAWRRDARLGLIRRNLAMAPLKISEDEIKKTYDALKDKQLTPPDQYRLRVIDVSTTAKAQTALDTLKKGVAFETVALTQSEDPRSKSQMGDIGLVPSTGLPPKLLEAVKDLKPNDYTKQFIEVSAPASQTPQPGARKHYFVAQLVEKKPGVAPPLEEARPIAIWRLIQEKDPNAFGRINEDIEKFKERSKIEIKIKGYERLLDKKPQPAAGGAPPMGAMPGQPGGP